MSSSRTSPCKEPLDIGGVISRPHEAYPSRLAVGLDFYVPYEGESMEIESRLGVMSRPIGSRLPVPLRSVSDERDESPHFCLWLQAAVRRIAHYV